jgi:phosphatidylglycerol:prolipoprotein diacylglycerol transferase
LVVRLNSALFSAAPSAYLSRAVTPNSVLAYYLHDLSPFIVEFGNGLGLRWYGLAYVAAFLIGYWLYRWLTRRGYVDMHPDQVSDFITWAAVFGVMLGGRLGWVLFYGWSQVKEDPGSALRVWEGGMSSHGGILGLVLFTLYYSKRHKLSWTSIGDSLCVVAPVGLFLVRCANFINGELWGKRTSIWWAVQFPQEISPRERPLLAAIQNDPGVRASLRELLPPRHPSQIYEALLEGLLLFVVLWVVRTRCRVPRGVLTGLFFVLYAVLRIIGEIFREPDPGWSVGPLSAGQFLSLFLIAIGAVFIAWGMKTRTYEEALTRHRHASAI